MENVVIQIKQQSGIVAFCVLTELIKPSACKDSIVKIILKFGRIDGLVNNAELNDRKHNCSPVQNIPPWVSRVLKINFKTRETFLN